MLFLDYTEFRGLKEPGYETLKVWAASGIGTVTWGTWWQCPQWWVRAGSWAVGFESDTLEDTLENTLEVSEYYTWIVNDRPGDKQVVWSYLCTKREKRRQWGQSSVQFRQAGVGGGRLTSKVQQVELRAATKDMTSREGACSVCSKSFSSSKKILAVPSIRAVLAAGTCRGSGEGKFLMVTIDNSFCECGLVVQKMVVWTWRGDCVNYQSPAVPGD